MIFLIGEISGAHINPGVTLAFALRRVFPLKRIAQYWAAQFGGAIAAGLLLKIMYPAFYDAGLTSPHDSLPIVFLEPK